jgi:hypothetical protein
MDYEQQARTRVENTPELGSHDTTIFYDRPNWDEHMEWIATAPVAEILNWAETVEAHDNELDGMADRQSY